MLVKLYKNWKGQYSVLGYSRNILGNETDILLGADNIHDKIKELYNSGFQITNMNVYSDHYYYPNPDRAIKFILRRFPKLMNTKEVCKI
jgi:hypothetical protein